MAVREDLGGTMERDTSYAPDPVPGGAVPDVAAEVRRIIAEVAGRNQVHRNDELVADLGIDSPKMLELLVEIEEQLGIEIPDGEVDGSITVADLEAYVPG